MGKPRKINLENQKPVKTIIQVPDIVHIFVGEQLAGCFLIPIVQLYIAKYITYMFETRGKEFDFKFNSSQVNTPDGKITLLCPCYRFESAHAFMRILQAYNNACMQMGTHRTLSFCIGADEVSGKSCMELACDNSLYCKYHNHNDEVMKKLNTIHRCIDKLDDQLCVLGSEICKKPKSVSDNDTDEDRVLKEYNKIEQQYREQLGNYHKSLPENGICATCPDGSTDSDNTVSLSNFDSDVIKCKGACGF